MVCCMPITASASGENGQRSSTRRGFMSHDHVTQLPWPKHIGPGSPPDPKAVICRSATLPNRSPIYRGGDWGGGKS